MVFISVMLIGCGIYILYLVFLLVLFINWLLIKPPKAGAVVIPVTVIVPFRNEEEHLPQLIDSLNAQLHPQFEVIFVDDHSEDQSIEILHQLLKHVDFQYQTLGLTDTFGKKAAITAGIDRSRYAVVVTTDADCSMPENWLVRMSEAFAPEQVKMAAGPVALTGSSLWQRMQSVESSSLIGTGGAMIRMKRPLMSNGANLAYRRVAFDEVKGFEGVEGIPSGDDELLMSKMKDRYGACVAFVRDVEALVKTPAAKSWREFRQQRLRWAGKWKAGKRATTIVVAIFVFLVQLIQLGLIFHLFYFPSDNVLLIITLLLVKLLIEFMFLWSVRRSLGQKMFGLSFLINYLLYPLYAMYFGIAANFGVFEWKGRQYEA